MCIYIEKKGWLILRPKAGEIFDLIFIFIFVQLILSLFLYYSIIHYFSERGLMMLLILEGD